MGSSGISVDLTNLSKAIDKQVKAYLDSVIYQLQFIGESAIREAKENGDYIDRTSNLRSSLGYVIVFNGKIHYTSSFEGKNAEGMKEGRKYAKEVAEEIGEDEIALVLVAGMNYAKYVASKRNVLDSAELVAKDLYKKLFKK